LRASGESVPPPISFSATDDEHRLIAKYRARYTITTEPRQYGLLNAINYLDRSGIPGDIVECGVWRGGNCMMVKEQRKGRVLKRNIYLFDTLTGMPPANIRDVNHLGIHGDSDPTLEHYSNLSCSADTVRANFLECGLDLDGLVFVEGPVEQTLMVEANLPRQIALLRLDTDWYESTKVELEVLYPRLVQGGVLIVDDYDCWQGSRMAVDEFFGDNPPLLTPLCPESRIAVKPTSHRSTLRVRPYARRCS
jgi:hypothetical protein